jgi:hypothetical protein
VDCVQDEVGDGVVVGIQVPGCGGRRKWGWSDGGERGMTMMLGVVLGIALPTLALGDGSR